MSITSKTQGSKITERLPTIEDLLDKPENGKKKSSSAKTLTEKINLPKLKSRDNSIVLSKKFDSASQEAHEEALFNSLKCVENAEYLIKEKDFKSCSNAVGPTECQLLFKVPSSELNDSFEIEEEALEEANALKRWKYWMEDKKRLQNRFSKRLERSPCDLLIQKSDKIRPLVEEKSLLDYSQIPETDRWRGHPYHWKLPVCLGKRKPLSCGSEGSPKYCAIKSKAEEKQISEMEFIGIPKGVQKEKGFSKSKKSPINFLEKMSYRQERVNYFMKQRKKLKPHDIEMDDLEIIGMKIQQEQEETTESCSSINVPEINILVEEEEAGNCVDYRRSVFSLVIDGEEIEYELGTDDCQDKDFAWQINFGVVTIRSLVEQVLRIENRGSVAVRYDWVFKNTQQKQSLDSLQPSQREPCFFFDKNSGFFLPGQVYDLKFYFHAKRAGVRKEVWCLRTKPPLSKNREISKIILSAVATEELSDERNALECYLRKRVRDSVVTSTIKILLYKVFKASEGLDGIEYRSLFCEKDLFEFNNPKYFYHSTPVKTLKELFEEIPSKTQREWDLSLDTLIMLIKTYAGKERDILLHQLSEKAKKLLRPNYLSVRSVKKYRMTYEILCKMTNFVEEDYYYIKSLVSEKTLQNEEKTGSDEEESEEFMSNVSLKSEEMSESSRAVVLFEIEPKNFIFFQMMFYVKMYHRICDAVEQIAGVLETRSLFQIRKQFDYKHEKPTQLIKDNVRGKYHKV